MRNLHKNSVAKKVLSMVIGGHIKGMTQLWSIELVFQPLTNDSSMFLYYSALFRILSNSLTEGWKRKKEKKQ